MSCAGEKRLFDFGEAIKLLKQGKKVSREGWNGRDMYLFLLPEADVPVEWIKDPHLKEIAELNGGVVHCLPSIRMFTVNSYGQRSVLTGWLASQSDILYEDWFEVL